VCISLEDSWHSSQVIQGKKKDWGGACSSELRGAQVAVTQGDGAPSLTGKMDVKCSQLWEWGILFWEYFSAWSIQSQGQAIRRTM